MKNVKKAKEISQKYDDGKYDDVILEMFDFHNIARGNLVMEEIKKLSMPTSKFYKALKNLSINNFEKDDKNSEEIRLLRLSISKNENDVALLLDKIKYVDVSLLEDLTKEIKTLKETNIELEKQVKALTNTNYDEVTDKETAELLISILDTYFTSFDNLDLNTKRNMIKLLVSSVTSDGEDVTISFLGARTMKDGNFPTGAGCKCMCSAGEKSHFCFPFAARAHPCAHSRAISLR